MAFLVFSTKDNFCYLLVYMYARNKFVSLAVCYKLLGSER